MVFPFRESGNATYQVTRASASDEGIYTCNATSPSGSKARTTLLDISGRYQSQSMSGSRLGQGH